MVQELFDDAVDELHGHYQAYLDRFEQEHGKVAPEAFVKVSGRLVKRLEFGVFETVFLEYRALMQRYRESIERGDTINDVVLRLLRDKAAQLALPPPTY
jgi:hypothetical protein